MSILSRFTNIMSCNVKSLFNKSNNSKKEIKKYIEQLELDLGSIKSEIEAALVQKERLQRELQEYEDTIDKYNRYYEKASNNGKTRDAKIYLSKKENLMPKYISLKEAYDKIEANNNKYIELQNKLINDITELKNRYNALEEGANSSKTEEFKEKADNMIYEAEALKELDNLTKSTDDDFNREFEKLLSEEDK